MQNKLITEEYRQGNVAIQSNDEFSINDLIREFLLWKNFVKKHIIKFFLIGLIGGIIGFMYAYFDTPLYTANTRFMLKNEGVGSLFGGQMTGLTSLLGGGQMGTPLERTAEVIASDRIVGRALLRKVNIRDTQDLVINHFIRLTGIRRKWAKDTLLRNIEFSKSDQDINSMTLSQRKAYKIIKKMMTPESGDGYVKKTFDKKSGVLTLSCVHSDEEFAIVLSKTIYDELSNFFIDQMTYTASNNAEVMRKKLDSIQTELNYVRRIFASQTDQSLGLLLQADKVDLKALAIKEQMLNVIYGETLKNYESYRFVNQAVTPSLTLIETPYTPLIQESKSKKIYSLVGVLLATIILLLILRVKHFIS